MKHEGQPDLLAEAGCHEAAARSVAVVSAIHAVVSAIHVFVRA